MSFLGHVIKHGNLHTRQETIDKIVNAPVPKTIKQVRAFLGLSGYYRSLYGRQFIIQTDHSPLQYLNSAKLSNSRLMRWAIKLQPFTYSVQAISGSLNIGADYLSRI